MPRGRRDGHIVRVEAPGERDGKNWQLVEVAPDGKKRQRSSGIPYDAATKSEAEAVARRREAEVNGRIADPLVTEVFDQHVAFLKNQKVTLQPNTLRNFDRAREQLFRVFSGVRDSNLTSQVIVRARNDLISGDRAIAGSTANEYMKLMGRAWTWAKESGYVQSQWKPPRRLRTRTDRRPLTLSEQWLLLDEFRRENYPAVIYRFFVAACHTGWRVGDVCSLSKNDFVRLDSGEYRIERAQTKIKDNIERLVCILSPADGGCILAGANGDIIFPHPSNERIRINDKVTQYYYRKAAKRLGIRNTTQHSFHGAIGLDATRFNVAKRDAMGLTGHKDGRVFDHYQRNAVPEVEAASRTVRLRREAEWARLRAEKEKQPEPARGADAGCFKQEASSAASSAICGGEAAKPFRGNGLKDVTISA